MKKRKLGLFLAALLAAGCASAPLGVAEKDRERFPLDPREGLAGPFHAGIAAGWDALQVGDGDRAEYEFRRAAEEGEGLAARIGEITAWVVRGQDARAVEACREALRVGEGTPPLLVACGEAYAARAEPLEALGLYERALARVPSRQGLRDRAGELRKAARESLLSAARKEIEAEQWDRARERTARAIEVDPKDPEARVVAAEIERGAGDPEKALVYYREALELGFKGPEAEARMAALALESGDHALAVALFDELALRDPQYAEAAAQARMAFRIANWPAPERAAAQRPRLTRADAATLVWWTVPEVREARVSSGVIASDVLSRRDSRAMTRALALGFLEVDRVTHRANPDAPLTMTAASRLLLRLLSLLRPAGGAPACLEGMVDVPRAGAEAVRLVTACGLLPQSTGNSVSGSAFTRALDRLRTLVGSGENARRE